MPLVLLLLTSSRRHLGNLPSVIEMRLILLTIALVVVACDPQAYQSPEHEKAASKYEKVASEPVKPLFPPSQSSGCGVSRIFPNSARITPDGKESCGIEEGLLNGVRYSVDKRYGSGYQCARREDKWALECHVNPIDDEHTCSLKRGNLWLVHGSGATAYNLGIGYDHYPGSYVAIRIDKNEPFKGPADERTRGFGFRVFMFTLEETKTIIHQLKSGKAYVTRFQRWPYKSDVYEKASTYGFKEALYLLDWLVENLDREAAAKY